MKSGGTEPLDYDGVLSRICEEFHCLPWQAEEQLERDPQQVFRILGLRAYRDMYQAITRPGVTEETAPRGPLVDLYADFELEALQQRIAEMKG